METIHNIDLPSFYDTVLSRIAALILGGLIGFEHQSTGNARQACALMCS